MKGPIEWLFDIHQSLQTRINMRRVVMDTTGVYAFDPESCSEVLTYNGDDTLATDTYTDPVTGYQFRQTYTYSAGNLTAVSGWVKL